MPRDTTTVSAQAGIVTILLVLCLAAAQVCLAATPLDSVSASPDVTVSLDSVAFADEDVAIDNLMGVVAPGALGSLPDEAEVTAYHLLVTGDRLFTLATATELPGPVTVGPRDIVFYDGASYLIVFDVSTEGVPDGVRVDALTRHPDAELWLSFDTTVALGTFVAADEDLVAFDGVTSRLEFDGSAAGVPEALDLDGAHRMTNGHLGLSFDGSGRVGTVDFDDEDVLEYDPVGGTWELAFDASSQHAEWADADLDAVSLPEPGPLVSLVAGAAGLLVLRRRRIRR